MRFTTGLMETRGTAPFQRLCLFACWIWMAQGSALTLGPDGSQNQAMEDLLMCALHQSCVEVCWGGPRSEAVVIPPPPSATPFLRLCVTITVPLAVTALCEKPIKPSCLCLVELAYVSFCAKGRVRAGSQGQASDPLS